MKKTKVGQEGKEELGVGWGPFLVKGDQGEALGEKALELRSK